MEQAQTKGRGGEGSGRGRRCSFVIHRVAIASARRRTGFEHVHEGPRSSRTHPATSITKISFIWPLVSLQTPPLFVSPFILPSSNIYALEIIFSLFGDKVVGAELCPGIINNAAAFFILMATRCRCVHAGVYRLQWNKTVSTGSHGRL